VKFIQTQIEQGGMLHEDARLIVEKWIHCVAEELPVKPEENVVSDSQLPWKGEDPLDRRWLGNATNDCAWLVSREGNMDEPRWIHSYSGIKTI
jgi:hypothetical protein